MKLPEKNKGGKLLVLRVVFFDLGITKVKSTEWEKIFLLYIIFQLLFTFSSILFQFPVDNIVVRQPYSLSSPNTSGTHLAPCIVITILLTILPMLLYTCDYFVTTNLSFLIPSPFLPSLPTSLPFDNHQSFLCIYEYVSVLFILFFKFHLQVK